MCTSLVQQPLPATRDGHCSAPCNIHLHCHYTSSTLSSPCHSRSFPEP